MVWGWVFILSSCTSDIDEPAVTEPTGVPVELKSYVAGYQEAALATTRAAVTRAWIPPLDPTDPKSERHYGFFDDSDLPISVFFTETSAAVGGYEEEFFFKNSDKWRVSKGDLEAKSYYLYGYIPHDASVDASISLLEGEGKTYADGAVLTLENLPTVASSDLCVIIAAKNGRLNYSPSADYSVEGLQRGGFEYEATASGSGDANYVYLLFDHLYSAMRFRIRVQDDYAALRTIKLKDLSLEAYQGSTKTTKKMNAVITLNATDGTDPISSIEFTPHGTEEAASSFFSNASGQTLTTEYSTFQAHFMPDDVTKLELTSTYDVYDRKGNLIRENCKATNTLDITKIFDRQTEAIRDTRYTISMTITPTYLYVLSDPDLDDLTMVVE